MHEKRRLRFATIDGLDRSDLPLAAEVWLEDLKSQAWISRDIVKLATLFTRYMTDPQPELLRMRRIEQFCQVDTQQVKEALRLMKIFGAVEAFVCEGGEVNASLRLSLLQRFRVLEIRKKFSELLTQRAHPNLSIMDLDKDVWLPEGALPGILDGQDVTSDAADAATTCEPDCTSEEKEALRRKTTIRRRPLRPRLRERAQPARP